MTRRPRIAHVMAGAANGGAELFFERLTMAQSADGLDILPVIRRNTERRARLESGGLHPQELSFGGRLDLLTRPRLRKALKHFKPDVTVAWMNRAARFTPVGDWTLVGRLGGFYDLSYYRHCQHLVGNTRGIVKWLKQEGWPEERAHYVPNFAADLSSVPPSRPADIPKDTPFILALGRLHRNKAFDVLIRALAKLPGVWLLIAGEGPERANLEELARREGVADRLLMPGWADPAPLIRECDVLVCPSRHEPLGNVVIEGFSAGTAVVAAASQGPTELIISGKNGLLAPVEDADALAACIHEVLENPDMKKKFSRAGRHSWENEYAPACVLRAWEQFLHTVSPNHGNIL